MLHLKMNNPWKYYHMIKDCTTFKEFLDQLHTKVTCEDVHTSKLLAKMINAPHSLNSESDRIVIDTYMCILSDL